MFPLDEQVLLRTVEVLVFAAPEPIAPGELVQALCRALELPPGAVNAEELPGLIARLNEELERSGRPYRVVESAGGYQFAATEEASEWLQRAFPERARRRFSQAALEVLAIVAYRQPITRAEIDAIRGVQSAEVVHSLLERGLLQIVGTAAAPGKPPLYGTTPLFLQAFGLQSLQELPPLEQLEQEPQLQLFDPEALEGLQQQLEQLRQLARSQ